MNGDRKGRASAMHRVVDRVERFLEEGQAAVAAVAGLVLVLLQLPGIQDLVEKVGVENSRLSIAFGALLLTSILLELRQLKRRVTPVISGRQHYSDPTEMYNALTEKASELTDPGHFSIDVLGLTLYSAWPQLEFFLERPETRGWTVRLAAIGEGTVAAKACVPDTWPKESGTTIAQVREFAADEARQHGHTIEIYEYDFAPAVHGFRLGNGDVFVSTLRWRPGGRLGKHRFPYDYVPAHDVTPEADAARGLLSNWFERAMLGAEENGKVVRSQAP